MGLVGLVVVGVILLIGFSFATTQAANIKKKVCGSAAGAFLCPGRGMSGMSCTASDGTVWPFSGCDVSAGICCGGKCGTGCGSSGSGGSGGGSSHMSGASCSASNGTVWPFSGCDVSAGICCNGKCGTGC